MPFRKAQIAALLMLVSMLAACQQITEEEITAESQKANEFFEKVFNDGLDRSPMLQTMLAVKKNYGEWDDISDDFAQKEHEIRQQELATLKKEIDRRKLDTQTRRSYDLFVEEWQTEIAGFKYRFHNYPVNQMFGMHSQVPAFLISMHAIADKSDAEAYISRLKKVDVLFRQLIESLKIREQKPIIPPTFVFDHVLRDCNNIINGSTLADDFRKKVNRLEDLPKGDKQNLLLQADDAIQNRVVPAYEKLITYLHELKQKSNDQAGVWKFPDGENFYNTQLARMTTTDLTAQQIHEIGLAEVDRIHNEMDQIREAVGFQGSLQDFFQFMRTDDRFYYENTDAARDRYMQEAAALIEEMKGRLDELFLTKPKADIVVKRVEPFREESAGIAFYQRPAPDGSRPGTYYANTHDMREMPVYQMAALAYHEGIPGHHMQIAISQDLEGIPKFRKFGGYTAYTEGWGLYSELLPREIGLYADPYADFGRLSAELWRACRLVVDTGIHYKKWTREQGIDYYVSNTPNPEGDAVNMVERHIIAAGQATAYKIGMLKILELRDLAKAELGQDFDIRRFHDVILTNGPVPLTELDKMVKGWIQEARS